MSRKINITIDPMGNTSIEGIGFTGNDCVKATAAIEKAVMGPGGVKTTEFKPSFSAGGSTEQRQTNRMG